MLDLRICQPECLECVRAYSKKHRLVRGDPFEIPCTGIPKEYISSQILSQLDDPETAICTLDPVRWAARYLDWHCIDPAGEIWKKKFNDGTLGFDYPFDPEKARLGKSPFHRPYQEIMLKCSSRRKVFRIGRQAGKTISLLISVTFNMITNKEFAVLSLTPHAPQAELIFKGVLGFIESQPELIGSVKRKPRGPVPTIELYNGSTLKCFTAGTKSKNEAGSIRGQKASMLVFDEADLLSLEDMDAAIAVITNFPNATVWMSSTPTGKRERFFDACNSLIYKEFHYSSHVNPMYNADMERYFRENYTEIGYKHEVLSIFGEQEEGVFQNQYIENAQDTYTYESMHPRANWVYTIGVDWNDVANGTVIIVSGFNPTDRMFYVCGKYIVSKDGWTQIAAMNKVIELNRIWHSSWIYVDHGYGSCQVELLSKFGHDAVSNKEKGPNSPDARFAKILKSYDFGSSVEIRDLFSKQPIKKSAKVMAIESTVRRFETGTIKYPRSDDKLTKSLQGYIIKRISQSGAPVYEASNKVVGDHLVDALALSMVAFVLEETEFGKPSYDNTVGVSGNFGQDPYEHESKVERIENIRNGGEGSRVANLSTPMQIFTGSGIPAAHSNFDKVNTNHIWSWPGFLRDEPPPKPRRKFNGFGRASSFERAKRSNIK